MKVDGFSGLVAALVALTEQRTEAFDVAVSSSAGFDWDPPDFNIAVTGITAFAFDGSGGEAQFDVSVGASVQVSKRDGVDGDKVDMGMCNGTLKTVGVVKYQFPGNGPVVANEISFEQSVVEIDADQVLD